MPEAAGSSTLLTDVRSAYVHGLDVMLWVCAGIAIASAVLALIFLPAASPVPEQVEQADDDTTASPVATTALGSAK